MKIHIRKIRSVVAVSEKANRNQRQQKEVTEMLSKLGQKRKVRETAHRVKSVLQNVLKAYLTKSSEG